MSEVILSSAVRSNLLSLQNTAALLETTQTRLATGLRVNSALDDPAAFFTASSLNSRAGDLNRLLDSVGLAVQTLEAADTGISAITDLVEAAQAAARNALQAPGPVASIATTTGNVDLTTADAAATVTGTGISLSADAAATVTGTGISLSADAAATVTGSGLSNAADLVGGGNGITEGETLTIDSGAGAVTYTFNATPSGGNSLNTLDDLVDAINGTRVGSTGVTGVTASNVGGQLVLTGDDADVSFTVGGTADVGADFGITEQAYNPTNLLTQGFVQGETLTINVGGAGAQTITFGTGVGEVSTLAELDTELSGLTGVTASQTNGNITLTGTNNEDNIVIGGDAGTQLGLSADSLTVNATNLLTQGFVQGETLTINVGGAGAQTITFGTGVGEVTTLAELNTELGNLTGVTASQTNGNLTLTASNNTDSIVVGGDAGTQLGLSADSLTIAPSSTDLLTGGLGITQGETLTISVGGTTTTITFGTGTSEVNTTAELDAALDAITGVSASIDGTTGFLSITAADNTTSFTLGGTAVTDVGLAAGANAPTAGGALNATRTAAENEFNNLLNQINDLAGDASFNGNNLLDGDNLTVIFNEDGSSSLSISGVTFNASGLGISTITAGDFQTDANINTTLDELDTAISSLRTQAATFGSNLSVVQIRQDFTKNLINTLETGAAGLTLADTNEEAANVTALQTRQSFSTSTLSLAARADQGALQLLR